jgi:hypothetical protein
VLAPALIGQMLSFAARKILIAWPSRHMQAWRIIWQMGRP